MNTFINRLSIEMQELQEKISDLESFLDYVIQKGNNQI